jgi:hypothetical protein
MFETSPGKVKDCISKIPTQQGAGRVTQIVAHSHSKHEALSSNPSTSEKKAV